MTISLRKIFVAILSLATATTHYAVETKTETAAAQPVDSSQLIADFRTAIPGIATGGSWQDKLALSSSGFVVQGNKGADGRGEMSRNLEPALDLSKDQYIEVAMGIGAKNEVPVVTVAFTDATGVQYTARITIDQIMPLQPVWFRLKRADFKLNNWQGNQTGKTIDWAHITRWHLQGDWATAAPFHAMFIALRTRP